MKATQAEEKSVVESAVTNASVEQNELGEVQIHENVISALVRKVVLGIEGISRLAGSSLVDNIAEIVGSRRMQDRAITVEIEGDNRVRIVIKVNLIFGYKLPEVVTALQTKVIEQVEFITGMTVTGVNVIVQELEDAVVEEEVAELDEDSSAEGFTGAPII